MGPVPGGRVFPFPPSISLPVAGTRAHSPCSCHPPRPLTQRFGMGYAEWLGPPLTADVDIRTHSLTLLHNRPAAWRSLLQR